MSAVAIAVRFDGVLSADDDRLKRVRLFVQCVRGSTVSSFP
jgi:hypothetical protein